MKVSTKKQKKNVFVKHYAPNHVLVHKVIIFFLNKDLNSNNTFLNSFKSSST